MIYRIIHLFNTSLEPDLNTAVENIIKAFKSENLKELKDIIGFIKFNEQIEQVVLNKFIKAVKENLINFQLLDLTIIPNIDYWLPEIYDNILTAYDYNKMLKLLDFKNYAQNMVIFIIILLNRYF